MNAFQFATLCPGCGNTTKTRYDGRCETCDYRKSRDVRVPRPPQPRERWTGTTIALLMFACAIAVVMLILGKVPPRP